MVDATDNAPSRYMISDCCVLLRKVKFLIEDFFNGSAAKNLICEGGLYLDSISSTELPCFSCSL